MSEKNGLESPVPLELSFLHKLQREMKSKVNALKPCLDPKPAFPEGFPTGRPVATAAQIAAQLGNGIPEGCSAHLLWKMIRVGRDQSEHIGFQHFLRQAFRIGTGEIPQLQQTDRQRRQQTQQAKQACHRLDLPLFNLATRFETGL